MENGCLGCKDRKVGCHSTCEKYKTWKSKIDTNNKARRKELIKREHYFYHK